MTLPHVTEPIIHQYSSDESFERGREYYRHGAVLSLVQRGQVLHAEVQGSDVLPYRVQCAFHPDGTVSATCTCPYDWGGWCKHLVATDGSQFKQALPSIKCVRLLQKACQLSWDRKQIENEETSKGDDEEKGEWLDCVK